MGDREIKGKIMRSIWDGAVGTYKKKIIGANPYLSGHLMVKPPDPQLDHTETDLAHIMSSVANITAINLIN